MQTDLRAMLAQIFGGPAGGDPMAQLRSTLLSRLAERSPDDPLRAMVSQLLTPREKQRAGGRADGADLAQMRALLRAAGDELNRLQERQDAARNRSHYGLKPRHPIGAKEDTEGHERCHELDNWLRRLRATLRLTIHLQHPRPARLPRSQ